jgi:uncharacterized protein
MAHVAVREEMALDSPTLVEGLPGVGLVGKIAADHLVETFDMTHYADVRCAGLPRVAVYRGEQSGVQPPVRLYADAERNLLVLQSDVPVSLDNAEEFATCITGWLTDNDVTPVFLSGLPAEKDDSPPELFGVATGDATVLLDEHGIVPPRETGLVSGPTGALLHDAERTGLGSVGLIVEADPQFPDPEAARALLEHGIGPVAGVDVATEELVEQAEEIRKARERLARRMQQADATESTQAQTLRGFQ